MLKSQKLRESTEKLSKPPLHKLLKRRDKLHIEVAKLVRLKTNLSFVELFISTNGYILSNEGTCSINGSLKGLPLYLKIFNTASLSKQFAPSP